MITNFMRKFYIYSVCIYDTKTLSWQCYKPDKWENIYKPHFDNYNYGPTWFWRYFQKGLGDLGKKDMNVTIVRHSKFASQASMDLQTVETLMTIDYLKIVEKRKPIFELTDPNQLTKKKFE